MPYPGTGQAATDLLGGRVQVMFSPVSSVLQFVAEGKVIALASTTLRRASAAPDLPTMSEAGLTRIRYLGLVRPAGAGRHGSRHHRAPRGGLQRGGEVPRCVATMARQGFDMIGGSPGEFAAFIRGDLAKWERVAGAAGLKR